MYKVPVLSTLVRQGSVGSATFWAPKVLSCPSTRLIQQSYSTTVKSVRVVEQVAKKQLMFARIQHVGMSEYKPQHNSTYIKLDPSQKKDVSEMLNVFEELEDPSPANMVLILGWVGRIVRSNERQKEALEQEKNVYLKLLDSIQEAIHTLEPRELGITIWALGKIKEKYHPLIKACDKAILSQDICTLDHKTISQIMIGYSFLKMRNSKIYEELESGIISGKVDLHMFDVHALAQILLSFAKAGNGSTELFNCFAHEILSKEFSALQNSDLSQFVWAFASRGFKADELFDKVEAECVKRISSTWKTFDLSMVMWAFASQGKGSFNFFKEFSEKALAINVKQFRNDDLSRIVWAFGKAGITTDASFDRIEVEVFRRGVANFFNKDREMMSEGFKLANRGRDFLQAVIT